MQGSQVPGTGAAGQKPAGDSPLGLFDALLTLISAGAVEGSQILPAPTTDQQTALNAFLAAIPAVPSATPATPATPAPVVAAEGGEETAPDLSALLGDLLDALGAAVPPTADGKPLVAPVENKLNDAIDALAKALGLTLPATGDETAPGADEGAAAPAALLDALKAIGVATTTTTTAPSPAPATAATPATTPTPAPAANAMAAVTPGAATANADGADVPPAGTDADIATAEAAVPKAVQAVPVPPAAVKLAERITALAKSIEPASPALAEKLAAIADRLKAGEIDAEALAKLGLPTEMDAPDAEIETAIARLLPAVPEGRPAAAPAPFTAATLALPELGAMMPKGAATTGAIEGKPAAPAAAQPRADAPTGDDEPQPVRAERVVADSNPNRPTANAAQPAAATAEATPAQTPGGTTVPGATPVAAAVSADTRSVLAAYKAPAQQINIPQVAFEIVRQVQAGNSRFQIRLDPPELGRIDVKLDVDKAGNVQARLTVERAETLDLMQRDHRTLERALAQAGLDSAKTNLEFSLRQNPFAHDERGFSGGGNGNRQFGELFGGNGDGDDAPAVPAVAAYRALAPAGGVNIFV